MLPVFYGLLLAAIAGLAGWLSYLDYKNPTTTQEPSAIVEIAPVMLAETTSNPDKSEDQKPSTEETADVPSEAPPPSSTVESIDQAEQKPTTVAENTPDPNSSEKYEEEKAEDTEAPHEGLNSEISEGQPDDEEDKLTSAKSQEPEKAPSTLEPQSPEPSQESSEKATEETKKDLQENQVIASVDPDTAKKFEVEKVPEGGKIALAPAPDPDLTKRSDFGLLPIISPAGKVPWRTYARPFVDPLDRPRIAIVMSDMGMSTSATQTAIQKLPGAITLSFNPYARNLQDWINQARAAGHEVLLQLPMEPMGYPKNDPGPHSLLTSLTDRENLNRLDWMLGRFTGYSGVTNQMGSRFTSSATDIEPILNVLNERGLLFLDGRTSSKSVASRVASSINMPVSVNNRFLDNKADRATIDARLADLERIARYTGTAVGVGYPYPVTLERLAVWAQTLNRKGLVLAPISATVNRQEIR
ncbi:divergent polysaccharide deacetylase family protein [Sneathiella limimaris]|uniref:divergent polysaccharide deacetylase family protein n=1 Tax=Sneathiella limimaris TaxID=1964213 RepID=UPI00146C8E62|nr:divergent polysaccharide deacetylase family protein [Sneathiella limimaris]